MTAKVKKWLLIVADAALAVYLVLAMVAFNHPDKSARVCTKVVINIDDDNAIGFLTTDEIKSILQRKGLYPERKKLSEVKPGRIEQTLKRSPFVKTAECYITQDGEVNINITQLLPVVRVKSNNGDDYYIDEEGRIMPHSTYTSDLVIATGYVSKGFARHFITYVATAIMADDMWRNLIEQINVTPDHGIEVVPRVGDHVVFLGYLPAYKNKQMQRDSVEAFVSHKLTRLEKFYKYGLSQAGWNKYSHIDLEFDNQIICKRRKNEEQQRQ